MNKEITNFYVVNDGPYSFKIIRKNETILIDEKKEEEYQSTLKEITDENFLISYEHLLNDMLYDFKKLCSDNYVHILNDSSRRGFYTEFIDLFLRNIILEDISYNTETDEEEDYVNDYEQQ